MCAVPNTNCEGLEFYVVEEDLEEPSTLQAACELDRRIANLPFVVTDAEKLPSWVSLFAKYYGCGCPYIELFNAESREDFLPCVMPGSESLPGKWTCDSAGMPPKVDVSKDCLHNYLVLSDLSDLSIGNNDGAGGSKSSTAGMLRSGFRFQPGNATSGDGREGGGSGGLVLAAKITVPVQLERLYGFNTDVMDMSRDIALENSTMGRAALPIKVRAFADEFLETERNVETYKLASPT